MLCIHGRYIGQSSKYPGGLITLVVSEFLDPYTPTKADNTFAWKFATAMSELSGTKK